MDPLQVAEDKKAAGKKDAKGGGGEDAAAAKAKAARATAQRRIVGYPVVQWAMQTEQTAETLPCVRWSQPALSPAPQLEGEEAVGPTAPEKRSGHSVTRMRDGVLLFGGSGERGLFGDVWQLSVPELAWSRPATQGKGPSPRAYHSASARTPQGAFAEAAGGEEQLIVFGGSDSRRRLNELFVPSIPSFAWSMPVVDGSPPPPRCWHSAPPPPSSPPGLFVGRRPPRSDVAVA